ncbi:MAG: DNA polymerase IV [Tissierellia bacterium]|nr:DNA polymerase IV [Tissierellia bacterium]
MQRVILHCDMNNCYASIEIKNNPKLKNTALAVAGSIEERHGIILAKNEIAKKYGIKTGEVIWKAKLKCPNLVLVEPHYDEYLKHSRWAKNIYYKYTDRIESFGIDECWLDVTESVKLFGDGEKIANLIREEIKEKLKITISVGVSYNKIFAKLASDLRKPDKVTVISKENFKNIVWPLEIDKMIGIGKKTKEKLNRYGIETLGQLANTDVDFLRSLLGVVGLYLYENARGNNNSRVLKFNESLPIKSIGRSLTLKTDVLNNSQAKMVFAHLSQKVSHCLIENNFVSTTIQITIRDNLLVSRNYQMTGFYPTFSSKELVFFAMKLLNENYNRKNPIRSIGLRAMDLLDARCIYQIDILNNLKRHQKNQNLERAIYKIRKKYGNKAIFYASLLDNNHISKNESSHVMPAFSY